MRPAVFSQEEFFENYEYTCGCLLALSGVAPLSYGELTEILGGDVPGPGHELGYTQSSGYPELREAVAAMYEGASQENVMISVGAVEALLILTNLLVGPDDEVVCLWPSFQPLHEHATAAGARVRFVELDEADGFQIHPERVLDAVSDATRLVLLNVPHNPTGATLTALELRQIAAALAPRGVYLLVDEVFREMWPEHEPSAWDGSPNIVVVGSVSKAHGLPGLRIGWLVAAPELVVEARRFRNYTSLNPGSLDQCWALCALRARERLLARTHRLVADGMAMALPWFAERGDLFSLVPPRGGGLMFPRLLTGEPTRSFCLRVLEETGVLLGPGSDCYAAEGFLRLGYATPHLADGLQLLAEYLP